MATSLLYLGLCLGLYSILVTASLGGVYMCSYCSCCGCCGVAGAAIEVAGGAVIRITCSTAVRIAGGISRAFYGASCGASCCGTSCWACWRDGACIGKAYAGGACLNRTCIGKACVDRACADRACTDRACGMG